MIELEERELLLKYRPWLRRVARSMCKSNLSRAEDLAQEGWIAIWRSLPTWNDGAGCSLDTWLKRKAEYAMLDVIRREQTQSRSLCTTISYNEVPSIIADIIDPVNALANVEMAYHHGEIAAAISSLPPVQRKYIFLKFWAGMDHKGITEAMGYSPSTPRRTSIKQLTRKLAHLGAE